MYEPIRDIFKVKILAACSQIALAVPISLQVPIDRSQQSVTSDVKLAIFVK